MDARSLKRLHERERKAQREFDARKNQRLAARVVEPPPQPAPAKAAPVVVPPRWVQPSSSSGDTDVVQKMMTAATLVMASAAAAMDRATGLGVAAHAQPEDSYVCLWSVVIINGSV